MNPMQLAGAVFLALLALGLVAFVPSVWRWLSAFIDYDQGG